MLITSFEFATESIVRNMYKKIDSSCVFSRLALTDEELSQRKKEWEEFEEKAVKDALSDEHLKAKYYELVFGELKKIF